MRKLVIISLILLAFFTLTGCSSSSTDGPTPSNTSGMYDSKDFRAEITEDRIDVYIIDLDEGLEYLYWRGTWEQGQHVVVSAADREALDASLMGSGSDNKEFTVDDDSLSFEFQAMGTLHDITLKKD